MNWKDEWRALATFAAVFVLCLYIPVGAARFDRGVLEALHLVRWYAREHVVLCLIPALFIAGAIAVFVSQASVMRHLGPRANKVVAYGVASVSGSILAVCSCTVLPLFAGIYRMGAGLGPATAFLYSGPAINVLAIILTARVLGVELGIARAVGAVAFSVVIGLAMHGIFRREETEKARAVAATSPPEDGRPLGQTAVFFGLMVATLVFANWGRPAEPAGLWQAIYAAKWWATALVGVALGAVLVAWYGFSVRRLALVAFPALVLGLLFPDKPVLAFAAGLVGLGMVTSLDKGDGGEWFTASWDLAKQILPLLFFGVLIAGALLGRPGYEGLIPSAWIATWVGGNSVQANFLAALVGAFMYFATLTEVPILQGLIGSGMGKGPALALLLAGPALSLPNMLVIRSVIGTKKTVVYIALVVVMATVSGILFGAIQS